MFNGAYDTYLESRVLAADPLELVRLLHQGAISAVQDARHYLAEGKVRERARAITDASRILIELTAALDRERGGEIAGRLANLYGYMLTRLREASFKQLDPPLGEVLSLLTTLSEGWTGAARVAQQATQPAVQTAAAAADASPWSQALPEADGNHAQAIWSL